MTGGVSTDAVRTPTEEQRNREDILAAPGAVSFSSGRIRGAASSCGDSSLGWRTGGARLARSSSSEKKTEERRLTERRTGGTAVEVSSFSPVSERPQPGGGYRQLHGALDVKAPVCPPQCQHISCSLPASHIVHFSAFRV